MYRLRYTHALLSCGVLICCLCFETRPRTLYRRLEQAAWAALLAANYYLFLSPVLPFPLGWRYPSSVVHSFNYVGCHLIRRAKCYVAMGRKNNKKKRFVPLESGFSESIVKTSSRDEDVIEHAFVCSTFSISISIF